MSQKQHDGNSRPENEVEDPQVIARRFDERAGEYDESAFHRALAEETVAFAGIDGVRTVLDVATGTGLVLRALPASVRMTGVDVSAGMIAVARRELPAARLIVADASGDLDLEDAQFDLITCATALHLLPSPTRAMRSWRRLLAPGGRVVVAGFRHGDATEVPEVADAIRHGAERRPHGSHDTLHERVGTPEKLQRLAEEAGFAMTRTETWVHREPLEVCLLAEFVPAS
ncbi:class I SAM-dependent methyltransferase [Humibacter sp.]|jgi:ubiquinone/menaquinone biosynthesis C-methylase UbiE|uniref:class I SAM-dependent methyltransferase n=1 Tax=Humibacter sp. TaxID=1940291 RepID=UPI002BFF5604|nr:methyltransferase domain-containing protein [Humibacter sp.]HVX06384.1 methyltransferase domain-containing protein [Humibacter sp.]